MFNSQFIKKSFIFSDLLLLFTQILRSVNYIIIKANFYNTF